MVIYLLEITYKYITWKDKSWQEKLQMLKKKYKTMKAIFIHPSLLIAEGSEIGYCILSLISWSTDSSNSSLKMKWHDLESMGIDTVMRIQIY